MSFPGSDAQNAKVFIDRENYIFSLANLISYCDYFLFKGTKRPMPQARIKKAGNSDISNEKVDECLCSKLSVITSPIQKQNPWKEWKIDPGNIERK